MSISDNYRAEVLETLIREMDLDETHAESSLDLPEIMSELHRMEKAGMKPFFAAEMVAPAIRRTAGEKVEAVTASKYQNLIGHTCLENSYLVHNYPFGGLKCICAFWIETSKKGSTKDKQRCCSATTIKAFNLDYSLADEQERLTYEPRDPHLFNKPRPSIYADLMFLVLDTTDGKVYNHHVNSYCGPDTFYRIREMLGGPGHQNCQMSSDQKETFLELESISRNYNQSSWREFLRNKRNTDESSGGTDTEADQTS